MHEAAHDPVLAERFHASRVLGGRASQALARLTEIEPADFTSEDAPTSMKKLLASCADAVLRGRITSSQATAVSQLVQSALKVEEARLSIVLEDLQAEVAAKMGRGRA